MDEQITMHVASEELPKNLVRILKLLAGSDTANATLVAEKLNIGRARASGYLNQLERLGFVKRFRLKRQVEFFLVKLPEEPRRKEKLEVSLEGITKQFNDARFWLQDVQNSDGGWGEYEDDRSNAINTAESILALLLMGESTESNVIDAGRRFIKQTLQNLNNRSETVQNVDYELESARGYALMGLALYNTYENVSASNPDDIRTIVSELRRTQDKEGYWDSRSIYSTAIAMRFLGLFADQMTETKVNSAKNWLLKNFDYEKCGWGRKPGLPLHLSVTARVVSSLDSIGCKDKRVLLARDRLFRETDKWSGVLEEVFELPGATPRIWRHFPLPCILAALLSLGENPESRIILNGIQKLLELQDATGGWRVAKGEAPRTWATLNAAIALDLFKRKVYGEVAYSTRAV